MRVLTCVGTRPNFIKVTRLRECFSKYDNIEYKLLHTGQHFDENMSNVFFKQLQLSEPDFYLNASGNTQIEQISDIMIKMEGVFKKWKPDWVIVPGDVNSSVACGFAASRHGIKLAHLESGLRSFDRTMPEEINRILIDDLSDLFFITEQSGWDNLIKEGKKESQLTYTGNTMIDALVKFTPEINKRTILKTYGLEGKNYCLMTFHRPANVDIQSGLEEIIKMIKELSKHIHVIFPMHPRTKKNIDKFNLQHQLSSDSIHLIEPLGYLDFLNAIKNAQIVVTDSGGIQEETTYLQIPCLTVRPNTERPVTITEGTNELIELNHETILDKCLQVLNGQFKSGSIPHHWDGYSSERVVDALVNYKA